MAEPLPPRKLADFEGVYTFEHPGGTFDVELRPYGKFHAPRFLTKSSWAVSSSTLYVGFGKYGRYEFSINDADIKTLSGGAVSNPSNWRKMALKRPFTDDERACFPTIRGCPTPSTCQGCDNGLCAKLDKCWIEAAAEAAAAKKRGGAAVTNGGVWRKQGHIPAVAAARPKKSRSATASPTSDVSSKRLKSDEC